MKRALLFGFLSFFSASAQQFVMSTLAGGLPPATPSAAVGASIGDPPRSAVDSAGNVYFAGLHAIFKIDRSGTLQRIAGTGHAGLTGDGGSAMAAQVSDPVGITVDAAGNVYYTERTAGLIRRISPAGSIATFASGLSTPMGLLADSAGNLYVAEMAANDVRRISQNGDSAIVAGNGAAAFSGDGGAATAAALNGPEGVALDSAGTLYVADTFNHRVRAVSKGVISTVAGNGFPGFAGDGGQGTAASLVLPTDVAVDHSGAVYIADLGNSRIRKLAAGTISTVAGNSGNTPPIDGLPATDVRFSGPTGVAVDASGGIYITEGSIGSGSGLDGGIFKIWKVGTNGKLSTVAGTGNRSFSGDAGPAALAQFDAPAGIAMDARGNLYVADSRNNRIRKIATDGTVTTVAGNALAGFSGEGGQATLAQLNHPSGVAIDAAGNLYIADTGNNRVREVSPNGIIGTLAGNGNTAFFGDGTVGYSAALNHPEGVAVDEDGTVYIADTGNHRIRRVVSGIIDTILDGLDTPSSVAVRSGQIAVADRGNGSVRLAGPVNASYALADARGVTIDSGLNVYATGANRVIKIVFRQPAATLIGTGQCCYNGDGGPGGAALLNAPWGIVVDPSGNLFLADTGNDAIRVATVSATTFFVRGIANSASNVAGAIAPGEVVTIYGAGLGPQNLTVAPQTAAGGVLPTDIAGTSVTFNGIAAPLLYASAGQVSAIVPYGVTGTTASVLVKVSNAATQAFPAPLTPAAPGIFTADASGLGPARAFNADGSANTPGTPALVGTAVTLYVTGEGQTIPAGVDGRVAAGAGPAPALPVVVLIGGVAATVQSAAGAAGLPAGVMQVTATVPTGVSGRVPVVVTVGGVRSQAGVTVSVE
jgi:trimeric autotransporter adhesin